MNSKNIKSNREQILKLCYLALLTALVFVLQLFAGSIRLGGMFSISLVLFPIVLGASLVGPLGGAWLGLVFALAVFYTQDASAFLMVNPFGTIVTVVLKGVLAGLFSGIAYKLFSRTRPYLRVIVASVVCPLTNTGIFLLGCLIFFMPTLTEWGASYGYANAGAYMIFGLTGMNFVLEFAINVALASVLVRLIQMLERQLGFYRK